MNFSCLVCVCVFAAFANVAFANRERKITEILEAVRKIEEHLSKEDRLREIADIIRIDSNVEKLNVKLDRVLNMLDNTVTPSIGRSDGSSSGDMQIIQTKLQNLEQSLSGVEETIKKMDFDPMKVNEIERRTTQLKDDMNAKLRKMMNVLTALYELNKDMKTNAESRSENSEQPRSESGTTNYATEFFMENLDELERKIKEQFSVLTSEIRSEVTSLKILASTSSANCKSSTTEDYEDEWLTPQDNARSGRPPIAQGGRSLARANNGLDNLVESLSRSTREIREEIQHGIQGLDNKLQNLTAIAQSQPKCSADSVITSRRTVMPFDTVPISNSDENSRRAKSDTCTKTVQNVPNPKSCADLKKGGATCDGIYVIFPKGRRAVRTLCDMTTDGGGWTIIMRRGDYNEKMTSFHRNWLSYKNGFGDVEGEFWLGNDVINFMTSEDDNMLRIHMSAFDGDDINLDYTSFSISNESTNYHLKIGLPVSPSNAANSLRYHNNHPFSTFDRRNDDFEQNCAATYKGGWWFNGCYFGFLNGEYFKPEDKRENWQGILWYDWKGNSALKGAEMMIRPKNFTISN
ncbi:techylectin-5B [Caerostris extrusa]|uniref:Techylectin-5B n=1 Tax=Caerostris extrusa TaxID=172846 RepID=A0AAV4XLW9_CAEEX|nr:techylectin-5B [Caerostris extrusa]